MPTKVQPYAARVTPASVVVRPPRRGHARIPDVAVRRVVVPRSVLVERRSVDAHVGRQVLRRRRAATPVEQLLRPAGEAVEPRRVEGPRIARRLAFAHATTCWPARTGDRPVAAVDVDQPPHDGDLQRRLPAVVEAAPDALPPTTGCAPTPARHQSAGCRRASFGQHDRRGRSSRRTTVSPLKSSGRALVQVQRGAVAEQHFGPAVIGARADRRGRAACWRRRLPVGAARDLGAAVEDRQVRRRRLGLRGNGTNAEQQRGKRETDRRNMSRNLNPGGNRGSTDGQAGVSAILRDFA